MGANHNMQILKKKVQVTPCFLSGIMLLYFLVHYLIFLHNMDPKPQPSAFNLYQYRDSTRRVGASS
jgi:hypothetical protein